MKKNKKVKNFKKKLKNKLYNFFYDEWGGDLIEYALLVGFALFIFFIIIGVVQSVLDWTLNQSNDFFNLIGG